MTSEPSSAPAPKKRAAKKPEPERTWQHITFRGDRLEVITPTPAAYTAAMMFLAAGSPNDQKVPLANQFIVKHLSAESYERVMSRMMDPGDDFDLAAVGELIGALRKLTEQKVTPQTATV